jgi:hypothetical protein
MNILPKVRIRITDFSFCPMALLQPAALGPGQIKKAVRTTQITVDKTDFWYTGQLIAKKCSRPLPHATHRNSLEMIHNLTIRAKTRKALRK